jgi:hypothetical protein
LFHKDGSLRKGCNGLNFLVENVVVCSDLHIFIISSYIDNEMQIKIFYSLLPVTLTQFLTAKELKTQKD